MRLWDKAFTLVEVMLAALILAFSLCGILLTYINMFILSDLSRDFTLATNAVQAEMEKIKSTDFTGLLALNGTKFDITGFPTNNAKGVVFVTDDHPGGYNYLMQVRIVACFKSRNRVIGEDTNLNGILDPGEDISIPPNARLDSPIEMVTLIAKRYP
jgi:type II secretory pathway pseudopilin PulG